MLAGWWAYTVWQGKKGREVTGEECGLLCEQNGEQKITKARKISKLNKMKGKQQQTQHGEEWMIIARERGQENGC